MPGRQAAFPLDWVRRGQVLAGGGRIDNALGDRNLVCSCPPMDDYRSND